MWIRIFCFCFFCKKKHLKRNWLKMTWYLNALFLEVWKNVHYSFNPCTYFYSVFTSDIKYLKHWKLVWSEGTWHVVPPCGDGWMTVQWNSFDWIVRRGMTKLSHRLSLNNGQVVVKRSESHIWQRTWEDSGKPDWMWCWAASSAASERVVTFALSQWVLCSGVFRD